jgi:hypothetical protein
MTGLLYTAGVILYQSRHAFKKATQNPMVNAITMPPKFDVNFLGGMARAGQSRPWVQSWLQQVMISP